MSIELDIKSIHLIKSFELVLSTLYDRKIKLVMTDTGINITEPLIRDVVCKVFNIPWRLIEGSSRQKEISAARQVYCYLMRQYVKGYTLKMIATNINKDHSSVISACTAIANYLKVGDDYVTENISAIINQFEQMKNHTNETETN